MQVVLFSDGYDPRGRSNYNVKVAILDLAGQLFDPVEGVPCATSLLTWRELPRADWVPWAVNGCVHEIPLFSPACATLFSTSYSCASLWPTITRCGLSCRMGRVVAHANGIGRTILPTFSLKRHFI